ncbi:TetR/AcrR family transcriptional regulator [Clostridium senegalense]|uniref:TetR/AcrR family transcriptional regulator n=1 Tax=Clostridium senegalense TaxID=1465809 RepID=UPI001C121C5F|nr:TetR-like C-terminal domain-containing protein [Clostridium senegalense]MBU5225139.1 TetR family transcriptional regulator C-terminal domain-containing protein [Clostridium senegalense]
MKNNNVDKRSVKTKKRLEDILFNLLKVKDINKITVKEITTLADINRSTFYDHYSDIYDLLESVQNKILYDINAINKNITINSFNNSDLNQLSILLKYIKDNKEVFKILLNGHGNMQFMASFRRIITEKFLKDVIGKSTHINKEHYNLISSFYISGCIGLIQNWVKNDTKIPIEKLKEIMNVLIVNSISSLQIN